MNNTRSRTLQYRQNSPVKTQLSGTQSAGFASLVPVFHELYELVHMVFISL